MKHDHWDNVASDSMCVLTYGANTIISIIDIGMGCGLVYDLKLQFIYLLSIFLYLPLSINPYIS